MYSRKISKDAKEIIQTIYNHLNDTGKWLGTKTLMRDFGPDKIIRIAKKYDPIIFIRRDIDQQNDHYELTIKGILLCSESESDKELLIKSLELIRKEYYNNPEQGLIKLDKIAEVLNLDTLKQERLRILLSLLLHGYSNTIQKEHHSIQFPNKMEEYSSNISNEEFLNELIEDRLKYDKLYRAGGWYRPAKIERGFWTLVITQVWTIAILLIPLFKSFKLYIIISCFWITLYSISNILRLYDIKYPEISHNKFIEKLIWFILGTIVSTAAGLVSDALFK